MLAGRSLLPLAVLALLGAVFDTQAAEVKPCVQQNGLVALCGVKAPEDLELMPDGKSLLVSQINMNLGPQGLVWGPSTLVELGLADGHLRTLYPHRRSSSPNQRSWGAADCTGEIGSALSPHGIHLSRRSDGAWQLLVVNHGSRESVEFFELRSGKELRWRGCAVAPEGSVLNDVAAVPDGGLVVSTMVTAGAASFNTAMAKAHAGENTGHVWRWSQAGGFRKVPGSDGPMPNGVAVDPAGKYLFFSAGGLRKIDLETGQLLGQAPVSNPDNLSWDGPKRLLVAGMKGVDSNGKKIGEGASLGGIEVAAVDADTLAVETLLSHDGNLLVGASVALRVGKSIYVGAFTGNRLLVLPVLRQEGGTPP